MRLSYIFILQDFRVFFYVKFFHACEHKHIFRQFEICTQTDLVSMFIFLHITPCIYVYVYISIKEMIEILQFFAY